MLARLPGTARSCRTSHPCRSSRARRRAVRRSPAAPRGQATASGLGLNRRPQPATWPPARRGPARAGVPGRLPRTPSPARCRGWQRPARAGPGSRRPTRPPGPAATSPRPSRPPDLRWPAPAPPPPADRRRCRPATRRGRRQDERGWLAGRPDLAAAPSRWAGRRPGRARIENWHQNLLPAGASRRPAPGLTARPLVRSRLVVGSLVGWESRLRAACCLIWTRSMAVRTRCRSARWARSWGSEPRTRSRSLMW
jgi:hypothetical protein